MAVDRSIVGKPAGRARVVVERAPVANFARAVHDSDGVYSDPRESAARGFPAMPAPPTFPFVMEHWGRHAEIQPARTEDGSGDDEVNPVAEVIGPLLAHGGIILHGEQEFEYRRPVLVGDVLDGASTVADVYEKESKGHVMTFVVIETVWRSAQDGQEVVTSRMNVMHRS